MDDLGTTAMQIMDALEEAANQMEHEARLIRTTLSQDGFQPWELKVMRQVLADKQAFYAQCHLVGLALEQMLDDTTPLEETTRQLHAAVKTLQEAEGDLLRVEKVAAKIERALALVVKLAHTVGAAVK